MKNNFKKQKSKKMVSKKPLGNAKKGSSIIEVLIALVLVGTVLTAVAATLMRSISSSSSARYREIATSMGQDMIEIFHYERSSRPWINATNGFYTVVGANKSYCANNITDSSIAELVAGACSTAGTHDVELSGVDFRRNIRATQTTIGGNEAVEVTATISWDAGNTGRQEVELKQVFQNWR